MKRRWSLDEATPFEAVRTLDPAGDPFVLERAKASIAESFPGFPRRQDRRELGRDDRRDARRAIPVISAVDAVPGFFIATGFSGHGFGIGPGVQGGLVADMVSGGRDDRRPVALPPVAASPTGRTRVPHPLAS